MGLLDRMHKIGSGFLGAMQAPFGLVKDLASAPFTDDEIDGIANTFYRSFVDRGGQVFGNVLGPEEGLGAAIGGLPSAVRDPIRAVTEPVLEFSEDVFREGISQPLATAITASSLADAPGGGGLGGLFRAENWSKAYRIAENRSPGQAFALAVGTEDITNVAEVNAFVGTDAYEVMSGTFDAVTRLRLDPTVLTAKGVTKARKLPAEKVPELGRVGDQFFAAPLRTHADLRAAIRSPRVARFNEALSGLNAAVIRDRFFPHHKHGGPIATILEEAGDEVTRMDTIKALMGDLPSLERLGETRAALAGKVNRLLDDRSRVAWLDSEDSLFSTVTKEKVDQIDAEAKGLYTEADRVARREMTVGVLREAPRARWLDDARTHLTRSHFYQDSKLGAVVRVAGNMVPHHLVNLEDVSGDIQIHRALVKAHVDLDTHDALRGEFMAAITPTERARVLIKAESVAVANLAKRAGMTVDEVEAVMARAAKGRGRAAELLHSRVYDGEGRSLLKFADDEDGVLHEIPLWVSQEANVLPLVDLDAVRKATTKIGEYRSRFPKSDIPHDLIEGFYKLWRPAVLLRAAWPIRVVGDEQLRIIAKIGALAQMKNLSTGLGQRVEQRLRVIPREVREAEGLVGSAKAVLGVGSEAKGQRTTSALNVSPRALGAALGQRSMAPLRQMTVRTSSGRVYEIESAYGAPGDGANLYKELTGARASFDALVGQDEQAVLRTLREKTGEWRSLTPDMPGYAEAWVHDVNKQIGMDKVGRKLLAGGTVDDVVRWMRETPEGQAYTRRIPERKDLRRWVEHLDDQVESYTAGNPELKALALKRKATPQDLERILPDATQRPVIHGELLQQTLGKSVINQTVRKFSDFGMAKLGSMPSDVLSRQPFFDHMYRAEVTRLVNLLDEQGPGRLTEARLKEIANRAREYALGEMKDLLYDFAEQSDLARMLRFWMPFYGAWQEVTTRWAGIAVENPAFVARARQVWMAPERAGIVTDENGAVIDENGQAVLPGTGQKVKAGTERFINMQMAPGFVQAIVGVVPGAKELKNARFSKGGFNMALAGAPGFGPVVAIPVNEIVKAKPELEDSLKWVLPFGTTQEWKEMAFPAWAKRVRTRVEGEDSRVYTNTVLRIFWDDMVDYNLGKRDDKPTYPEAKAKADAFYNMRTAASFFLPVAPGFQSPYQIYIDAYRQRKEIDPEGADEWFLDTFGEEFFPLTQSLSKSVDGVPPTLEGYAARKRYQDMIEQYPDLGGLIVGAEGAGEFARSVYDAQLQSNVAPGSESRQREAFSFEEASIRPEERLGWIEFGKAMDLIDAARIQRGLPNLQVKEARDLAALKRIKIERIAERYPAWYEKFSVTDRNAAAKRIEGMREIAADNRLAGRQDIAGLRDYLRLRDLMSTVLGARPAKTITASANQDLAVLWETLTGHLVEKNLAFSALFHRYLERDMPEAA